MTGSSREGSRALASLFVAAAFVCADRPCPAGEACPIQLRDVTSATGITFKHTDGSGGMQYIIEAMTAGVALFDYDGDGDVDIYFLNGAPLKGTKGTTAPTNALWRNDGGLEFTDVTLQAGVGDKGYGLGVAVGDYDNDGDQDIYVNNLGPNVLYRNDGDGKFTDVTAKAGAAAGREAGAGANFLDVDKDGDLDLFVANYVKWSYETNVMRKIREWTIGSGPRDYPRSRNVLFRNNGNGTFADISAASDIASHAGAGMGTVCADYDNDGDTDIIVANDDWGNFLFRNDGTGRFEEVGLASGIAYDLSGDAQSSMGVACGDYNNDGLLDVHVTSYQREMATLYKNLGGGLFADMTRTSGAGAGTLPYVTWGNGFVDFDNDGDRDLFIACGHLIDSVEEFDDTTMYHTPNILLMNTGDGKFVNVSKQCGDGLAVKLASRGAGFDDLDNDGDGDAVILNSRREPTILSNESAKGNHWVQVRLRGTKTNRDGVGARVKVTAGDLTQIDEVHSGRGYQSHYGTRLHFGLGTRSRIDRIEVRWIGGGTDVLRNLPADRLLTITEGSSKAGGGDPSRKRQPRAIRRGRGRSSPASASARTPSPPSGAKPASSTPPRRLTDAYLGPLPSCRPL